MTCVEPEAAGTAAAAGRCQAALRRIALLPRFLIVARRYWICLHPVIRCELRRWRARAGAIPDPALRRLAFEAHNDKRGNLEGAAAFAVFAPKHLIALIARALIAFQGAYDYVDVLSEQESEDRIASGYRLHLTLVAALTPGGAAPDGYAHHPLHEDAGYLAAFVAACRTTVAQLPSYPASARYAREGARRIAVYQGLNNWGEGGSPREYARWAAEETPAGSGLRWWETGAAAGSSLSIFAAIAAAADALTGPLEAAAIDRAYFPWIGALHTLLDSLVDQPADVREGHHSLVAHYGDAKQTARRMGEIAATSTLCLEALPDCVAHAMLQAAMTCFYLVAPEASLPHAAAARHSIVAALGELARPTMAIMRARQMLRRHGGSTVAERRGGGLGNDRPAGSADRSTGNADRLTG